MKIIYLLPYAVPAQERIKIGQGVEFDDGERLTIELRFSQRKGSRQVPNVYESLGFHSELNYCLVEAEFTGYDTKGWDNPNSLLMQRYVHLGLQVINNALASLVAAKEIVHLLPVSLVDLPMYVPFEIENKIYLFVTDPYKLYDDNHNPYTKEETTKAVGILNKWLDPYDLSEVNQLYFLGKQKIMTSQYISGLIELQTSFEIYINKLMRNVLRLGGASEEQIENAIEKENFRKKIEKILGPKIDVDLSFEKNPQIQKWRNHLYRLRNEIVHSGNRSVDPSDYILALKTFIETYNYLADLTERKFPQLVIGRTVFGVLDRSTPENKKTLFEKIKGFMVVKP